MPISYKFDVIKALKEAGYNTNRIRKEKIIGESTLQKLREGKPIDFKTLETICKLLECQPGDIIEYVE